MLNLQEIAQEHMKRVMEIREKACETSLQLGSHGVKETWYVDGRVTFEIHPDVPYGEIHVYHK